MSKKENKEVADQIKKFMDVIPDQEDCESIRLIIVQRQFSQSMLQNKDFADGTKSDVMVAYYKAALDTYAKAQYDENAWWKRVNEKYKLPLNGISFDFTVDRFYSMVDA